MGQSITCGCHRRRRLDGSPQCPAILVRGLFVLRNRPVLLKKSGVVGSDSEADAGVGALRDGKQFTDAGSSDHLAECDVGGR
jgi:hypothetical protein